MGPLAAVERFLERLFERQAARLFRTAIRPVQVQRRLERAMEGNRVRDGARTVVPHAFVIRLHPDDLAALRASSPQLAGTLADGALAFARSHGYTLLDRPIVTLRGADDVLAGDIAVDALDPYAVAADDDAIVEDPAPERAATRGDAALPAAPEAGAGRSAIAADPTSDSGAIKSRPAVSDQTAVFVVPGAEGPRATLREIRPDRSSRSVPFDGRPLTIGRAPDNGLVLRDGRASRHHARIDARRGSLVLTDLGSTNGSFVNDRPVESIALGEGDRIRIGTTTLIVEAISSARATVGPPQADEASPARGAVAG